MPYKNPQDRRDAQKRHRQKNRTKCLEYLKNHPCIDCGESDPIVLEFDHLGDKKYNIGTAVSGSHRSWELILQEIQKCEVRCANCHRKKTAERAGNWYT